MIDGENPSNYLLSQTFYESTHTNNPNYVVWSGKSPYVPYLDQFIIGVKNQKCYL